MALTIETSPSSRFGFRWNFAHNPYLINFKREDVVIYQITVGSPIVQTRYHIGGGQPPLEPGDSVYTFDVLGNNTGSSTVVQVFAPGTVDPTRWVVETDNPFQAAGSPGYMNFGTRVNYNVRIDFFLGNTLVGTGRFYGDAAGNIKADIKEYLLPLLKFNPNFDYRNGINRDWPDLSTEFTFEYREDWTPRYTGQDEPQSGNTPLGINYGAVKGAKQRRDELGSNAGTAAYGPAASGDFMTEFEEPCVFLGYPSTLSFLLASDHANYVQREAEQFDLNGASLGAAQQDDLNMAYDQKVNGLATLKGITVNANTKFIDLELKIGAVLPGGYFGTDPAGTGCGSGGSGGGGASSSYAEETYAENT